MKKFFAATLVLLATLLPANAQIIGSLPYTLTNGTIADANQVMANFNAIVASTNSNAANAGVNSNITSITGLITPLSPSQGGSSVYSFGTSTGSANAQIVASPTPSGFQLAQGRRITFIAGFTNTLAATLNVNSTGAINIFKPTTSGISALIGGEIVAGAPVDLWYDGTQYLLLNSSPQSLVPTGTVTDFAGHAFNIPSGWYLADGSGISRTTDSALFAVITRTFAGAVTATSISMNVATTTGFQIGHFVGGPGMTCNSTIVSIPDATHIEISAAAGSTTSGNYTTGPYPQGDCSSTFSLPDFRGRATAGVDGSFRITALTCTNSSTVGSYCGAQTVVVGSTNIPVLTGTASFGSTNPLVYNGTLIGYATGANVIPQPLDFGGTTVPVTVNSGSPGTAINKLGPVALVYKIIKR